MLSTIDRYHLSSSVKGKIRLILLVYLKGNPFYRNFLEEFLAKTDAFPRFFVLVDTLAAKNELTTLLDHLSYKYCEYDPAAFPDMTDFAQFPKVIIFQRNFPGLREWIRDPFLVMQDKEGGSNISFLTHFHVGSGAVKLGDALDFVQKPPGFRWFLLEGGGLLSDRYSSGERFVLVNVEQYSSIVLHLRRRLQDIPGEYAELIAQTLLRELFDVEDLIVIDYIHRPKDGLAPEDRVPSIFSPSLWLSPSGIHTKGAEDYLIHLDLFMSLTGCTDMQGKYMLLVADLVWDDHLPGDQNGLQALKVRLDGIADDLTYRGFRVIRNDIYVCENADRERQFGFYNNCLVEVTGNGERTVWLPAFGDENPAFTPFDESNYQIWKDSSLGFDVRIIKTGLGFFARRMGSIHCLTNELYRDY